LADEQVTPGEVFARRMREVRTRRGWSQRELADRLHALGHPIGRVTLTRIEQGGVPGAPPEAVTKARNVSLEDVLAISFALGVAPVHMFVPFDLGDRLCLSVVSAKQPVSPGMARRWIAGIDTLLDEDPQFFFTEIPPEDIEEQKARALRVTLGEPTTATAFFLREEMAEKGEAPPIVPPDEDEGEGS
jgi:transcriptional regulator with XRE-family HTH domain